MSKVKKIEKTSQELLRDAFKSLLSRMNKIETFTLKEAPEVCRQIVLKEKIRIIIAQTGYLLGLVLSSAVTCYSLDKALLSNDANSGWYAPAVIFGFVSVVLVILLVITCEEFITLKFCPKLFLLEKLRDLVGGS